MRRLSLSSLIFPLLCGLLALPALAQDTPDEDAPAAAPASAAKAKKKQKEYVKLTFRSSPSAEVWYGRKLLGTSPVTIRRRKDSGPVDVVFKAAGYIHTASRAYSWSDDTVHVRLTPRSQANTLFGYKKPVEEDPEGGGDDEGEEDAP